MYTKIVEGLSGDVHDIATYIVVMYNDETSIYVFEPTINIKGLR